MACNKTIFYDYLDTDTLYKEKRENEIGKKKMQIIYFHIL